MKYLISLHFDPGWGIMFIYLSILMLLAALALAVIEDAKSGTDAEKFAKLRERWLLPSYVVYWGVYVVSLFFAQCLKSELPAYEYKLTENGCKILLSAGIVFNEFSNGSCSVDGNSVSQLEQQLVIKFGTKQILMEKCDIQSQRLRGFEEFRKDFNELYDQKGWWP